MSDAFYSAYFETVFYYDDFPVDWPESFAIISACAPPEEKWTSEETQQADAALQQALSLYLHHRVTGCSRDFTHQEPSWAVACSYAEALRIGKNYRQDAIFWVTHGQIYVAHCVPNATYVPVDPWSERRVPAPMDPPCKPWS